MAKTINWLMGIIRMLILSSFTGRVTIDFYKGAIGKIQKTEAIN
jgi:hypothetical protein